ncbi:MAG: glutamate-cysteine ligase family protein [Planctomycetota bacterium]|nr:glutamate-cysteine ligase family protein [Planctomycetota bacterium]
MTLHLFDAVGVELEYMIVDARWLDVNPITDKLFERVCGHIVSDVEHDDVDWSNELVRHVVELKTSQPARSLAGLEQKFQTHVQTINRELKPLGSRLLPSAMHPWMDPHAEMQLWPHDNRVIYEVFNRIFDCRGHGWANLQSMHLNLPFCGAAALDDEFGRLHAAIRLLLPILPTIAASSPIVDGRLTGLLDNRLEVYRTNARRLNTIVGRVIPEPVFTQDDYQRLIFDPMFAEIAPHDPDGVLKDEFLNARGAIARFGRGSIEIRVIDIQECPAADLAVAAATVAVLKALVHEQWSTLADQQLMLVEPLHNILLGTIRDADETLISDADFLRLLGWRGETPCRAIDLWRDLLDRCDTLFSPTETIAGAMDTILSHGPLARRVVRSLPAEPSREQLAAVYRELADCLAEGRLFESCRHTS